MEKTVFEEATGVYVGTLQEDMIDTVKRTKKMYCDVLIPEFFTKFTSYPLTYVPLWAAILPLKKGDRVLVKFNQDNLKYPILYKNDSEVDSEMYSKFNVPSGTVTSSDTVSVIEIGKDSYILKTDNYTVIRNKNDSCVILTDDGKTYVCGNGVEILGGSGKVSIANNTQNLKDILNTYLETQKNIPTVPPVEDLASAIVAIEALVAIVNSLKVTATSTDTQLGLLLS